MLNKAHKRIITRNRVLCILLKRRIVNLLTALTLAVSSDRSGYTAYILLSIYFFNSIGLTNFDIPGSTVK